MIKRIIFFVESPFNERDYNRFGIDILKKNGFEVDIWNFTPILHPTVHNKVFPPDPIDYKHQRIFTDKITAVNEISKLSILDLVVLFFNYSRKGYFIYRNLSRHNIKYCTFAANALPIPSKSLINTIQKISSLSIEKFINAIFSMIQPKLFGVNGAAIILAGGSKSVINYNNPKNNKSKILWIHALDYDLYLQQRDRKTKINEKYSVFLDEYFPFHPDYILQNVLPPCQADEYYPILNKFFGRVEKKFDVQVVIAAHPRSKYEEYSDFFESRECIRGKTLELIKDSDFVIAHSSTAINFAVLFEKPIIFVTTKKIDNSFLGPYIKIMSSLLGTALVNLDNSYDITQAPRVDKRKYDYYRNSYVKMDETPELPFWQTFSDYIKNI